MAEKVIAIKKLFDVDDSPQPDNLGEGEPYVVKIQPEHEFKRGLLMMSSSDNFFVPATREGAKTADELCVLAEDLGIDVDFKTDSEGEETAQEYTTAIAYFQGRLSASAVILDYETEGDNHDALIEELRPKLRKQSLNLV